MSEKKNQNNKYSHLLAKKVRDIPWDRLLVDIIGSYKIRGEGQYNPLIIKALTMIEVITRWFKIIQYNDKQAATIENIVEQSWLYRYPRPEIITYDWGGKFLGGALKKNLIKNDYIIKAKCETTENPQANSMMEQIHLVIEKCVRTFDLQNNYLHKEDH